MAVAEEIRFSCNFRLLYSGCPVTVTWSRTAEAPLLLLNIDSAPVSLSPHLVYCLEVDPSENVSHKRQSPGSRWEILWLPVSDHINQK